MSADGARMRITIDIEPGNARGRETLLNLIVSAAPLLMTMFGKSAAPEPFPWERCPPPSTTYAEAHDTLTGLGIPSAMADEMLRAPGSPFHPDVVAAAASGAV